MGFIRQLIYATIMPPRYLEAIKTDALKKISEKKKEK